MTYQVSISRTGGSTGTLKVNLRTSEDTASSGSDYDSMSQDFTFNDNDVSIGKSFITRILTVNNTNTILRSFQLFHLIDGPKIYDHSN